MSATEGSGDGRVKLAGYADTSFLVSLLVEDANSVKARSILSSSTGPVGVSPLGRLEFRTAIWQRVGRVDLTSSNGVKLIHTFEKRFKRGYFHDLEVPPEAVWLAADRVSDRHTARVNLRSLDIWHIAFAVVSGTETILTFDDRMIRAARAEGLTVNGG